MSAPPAIPIVEDLARSKYVDVLIRIDWTNGQVSRLTSAHGGCRLPADTVEDAAGAYYAGVPKITQLPALKQLMNGTSDDIDLGFSGLSSQVAALADNEAVLAEGAEVHIGKVYWAADQSHLITRWTWLGGGGQVNTKMSGGSKGAGKYAPPTWTIMLNATTGFVRRAGASLSLWSDAQHQRLHPGDRFFEWVNALSVGLQKAWPKF